MPPILALIICTIFVLWLLQLERKESPDVSNALWIPTIAMLMASTKSLAVWLGMGGESVEAGSPLDRNVTIMLICLGLIILFSRKIIWSQAIKENIWLSILLIYTLISVLWSDIPFISLKRWVRELAGPVMACIIITEREPRQAVESMIRRTAYILVPFSLMLIKYYPFYGVQYGRWSGALMWSGATPHKNGLGRLCFIATFFLIWSLIKRWKKHDISISKFHNLADIVILALALWMLKGPGIGAHSATSVGVLAIGLFIWCLLVLLKKFNINLSAGPLITVAAAIMIVGVAVLFVDFMPGGSFATALGRNENLTGRTDIWAYFVPLAMQHPLLGFGFGGFWTTETIAVWELNSAHNGYLDTLLDMGFVGMFFIAMLYLSACWKAHKEMINDFEWGIFFYCMIIMFLFYNITESIIGTPFSSQFTLTAIFLSVIPVREQTKNNNSIPLL